ncbi:flagellar protein FlaG [Clostridium botulinum C]|uniref:Flagellar protein FlaG n=2 Tax=Clostridium botulinum TaxID=1491 RepID=A0A9Q4XWY8_CLOBO|nr:flagellar protein FlaG [Clostridium botulinum]MCD3194074.1 flagellar protein FlaG [Clostridium botulinum C]MCD3199297.1 flagellar protein FlaG [Clostridium botulinum C]MCD3204772.1 flagellar protein FlaG [Clostridium botulinum C]MCD3207597.1 flagellar protein FlaG [Clostridium botulinum C]MCD3224945.1 flagellar protein FlaG [Clostridium botulinum C]
MEFGGIGGRRQISSYIKSNILKPLSNDSDIKYEENYIREHEICEAINKINDYLKEEYTHIEYETYEGFKNQFIIKIVDNVTKKTIKEIPPKKILDMVSEICRLAGVIMDKKV